MKKNAKISKEYWSESVDWKELNKIIN
jgi:hypothetical protein